MKVDLTLGESKTKVDLTLESRPESPVLDEIDALIDDSTYLIDNFKSVMDLESKTKDDLSLETK